MATLVHQFLNAWKFPRWRWALVTAVLSDALGFGAALFPPAQWLLDAVTALVLLAVLGFRWPLLLALAIEVVPALAIVPGLDPGRGGLGEHGNSESAIRSGTVVQDAELIQKQ